MVDLSTFIMLHHDRRKTAAASGEPAPGALAIDTCLRRLRLSASPLTAPPGWSYWQGAAAYAQLLEIACGLNSAIPGETHVFGQIKSAWQSFSRHAAGARALRPILQALFADTKRIRARFLQGIGRQSYGRLAKALVLPDPGDRILIVGAGEMAREMASSFAEHPLAVWARCEPRGFRPRVVHYRPGTERQAVRWADRVVFCTPAVPELDQSWSMTVRGEQLKTLLHLGYRHVPQPWAQQTGFFTLHDLFKLKRARSTIGSLKLAQARRACRHAAAARIDQSPLAQRQVALR